MQIELTENTQEILSAQASAHGSSLSEFAAGVLARYADASSDPLSLSRNFAIETHEDALAWILSRNPNPDQNHPEEIDWQKLKSEGRSL